MNILDWWRLKMLDEERGDRRACATFTSEAMACDCATSIEFSLCLSDPLILINRLGVYASWYLTTKQ